MSALDVVVIGAGTAGTAAALRCAESGLRVLLLDAAEEPSLGGNTALSAGGIHYGRLSLDADPDALRAKIMNAPVGTVRADLADALVNNAARSLAWLRRQGVVFEEDVPGDVRDLLAPLRELGDGLRIEGERGPQLMLSTLYRRLTERGGAVRGGARARRLAVDEKAAVNGVVLDDGELIETRHVVLADGGFQSNAALRRRFLGPATDRIWVRGASTGNGDCLLMAEEIGAALSNTEYFYGHCMHRDALTNERLQQYPALDDLFLKGAIIVDAAGRRFVDESRGGIHVANVVARFDDPLSTFVVMTKADWEASAGELIWGHRAPNPELVNRGGTVFRAVGADALAADTGLDAAGLRATVGAAGMAGPLMAFPVVPGISMTTGGVVIDPGGRVLDRDHHVIGGLYAAGETAVSVHGGYIGGLATALIQGVLAGESASADIAHSR